MPQVLTLSALLLTYSLNQPIYPTKLPDSYETFSSGAQKNQDHAIKRRAEYIRQQNDNKWLVAPDDNGSDYDKDEDLIIEENPAP